MTTFYDSNNSVGSLDLLDVAHSLPHSEHTILTTLLPAAKILDHSEEMSTSSSSPSPSAQPETERDDSSCAIRLPTFLSDLETTASMTNHARHQPNPQGLSFPSPPQTSPVTAPLHSALDGNSALSWQAFLDKYAAGSWDASKPPPKPVQGTSSGSIPRAKSFSAPLPPPCAAGPANVSTSTDRSPSTIEEITQLPVPRIPKSGTRTQSTPRSSSSRVVASKTLAQRRMGEAMALSHAPNADGTVDSGLIHSPNLAAPGQLTPGSRSIPDLTQAVTDAATVRLAGANAKVAPLTLSSPESELLDPLRHLVSSVSTPLSQMDLDPFDDEPHVPQQPQQPSATVSSSFPPVPAAALAPYHLASGSDVQCPVPPPFGHTESAETVKGLYPPSPQRETRSDEPSSGEIPALPQPLRSFNAAGARSMSGSTQQSQSYAQGFGYRHPHSRSHSRSSLASDILQHLSSVTLVDPPPSSVQTQRTPPNRFPVSPLSHPSTSRPIRSLGSGTLEETSFRELGFLVPPRPLDEFDRRKALHRFGVLNTPGDANFDRITHLAKLVFHAKWVQITLIDDQEVHVKHTTSTEYPPAIHRRDDSFCGHTILQKDDVMVVLDATQDWRFAGNPYVTGPANVRFYAGAPLSTSDGYNIGTMCVVDPVPRAEFGPRQRHTLKEFAAIAMREIELWRDKIQLRIRDRIQTSMENFTRECLEMDSPDPVHIAAPEDNMRRVYESASRLVKRTLDVEGALIVDVSNFEVLQSPEAKINKTKCDSSLSDQPVKRYHGNLFEATQHHSVSTPSAATDDSEDINFVADRRHEYGCIPAPPLLASTTSDAPTAAGSLETDSMLSGDDHHQLSEFLVEYLDGKIFERVVPSCFRSVVPSNIQYAMLVPIFNLDGKPFIMLCAYTTDRTKHFLEGYELQFLRAIGVIILSAVLKRRMMLADKAKSLFISNISHELRTPLHGILAAAELLSDTGLTMMQHSFLQTVQACGTSLVETVNHVLDFSKLSGNSKAASIKRAPVDLFALLEDTIEGSWMGSRARAVYGASEIGSAYCPPKRAGSLSDDPSASHVEIVLDVGYRTTGWYLKCEKGGIRRVLINLLGNSLKFTSSGFIHIALRELPPDPESPVVRVELAVIDSGKGISKDFLKNHLFHPFTQENPLQTGTGLGLAIVNSIVKSEGINGKVDVWSSEGVGTEIRVAMDTELPARPIKDPHAVSPSSLTTDLLPGARIAFLGFDTQHKGQKLLQNVLSTYLTEWWHSTIAQNTTDANIIIINEDVSLVKNLGSSGGVPWPVVFLTTSRGDEALSKAISVFEGLGGFCRIVFKPCRPSHIHASIKDCLKAAGLYPEASTEPPQSPLSPPSLTSNVSIFSGGDPQRQLPTAERPTRSFSDPSSPSSAEGRHRHRSMEYPFASPQRPMITRSATHMPTGIRTSPSLPLYPSSSEQTPESGTGPPGTTPLPDGSSIRVETRGSPPSPDRPMRVLIVEDNHVNRTLLVQWLKKKNFDYEEAMDGQQAVDLYSTNPPGHFEAVLIDMCMPVLDGVGATEAIREVEKKRTLEPTSRTTPPHRVKIFALSGLASQADKLRAFNAGVDGYLVKPVSFKTLTTLFDSF
ncbi:uncharacterized protein EI90DRAFT_3151262 [Cantharellus anzutake]|uniref:uncharacterized protein n=1 Tax=Cantharellus anzutake TaxID=1750568 RepID=UPI001906AFFD|nr:uncharacterized protein EI90DRAFT_3151262 [Cantharellus anzutake]KAF8339817.1 hypothetical protein EI90DRAFT_3151262 [Cantharellus anzutake]